ncbi:TPM domain-containing protein [Sphingomonas lutea]|uniref:TPM domain-containing protein n=1 Tax=Sphingomonas lutea TaxID=1045317 RepID=A0A7G9SKD3_9SPHN|nr:TPM domain-containing protein [Sphingomonas lutea]QNN68308.1 TPM domain-containing protein [Sphingomonas lutea]
MARFLAVFWLALLALAAPAAAQTFPQLTGRVVDQADLLRPEQELDLASKSEALEAQTGRQFVIATVRSLEGRPIEDYGYRLGRAWKIGDEKRDDGVILLVAPAEKKVRIETGYGARVFLTDALSSVIVRDAILPRFRAGDFAGGITAGADQIVKTMSLSPAEAQRRTAQAQQQEKARDTRGAGFLPVIFIMIVFFMIIRGLARRPGGRRFHSRDRRRGRSGIDPWVVLWGLEALSHASRGRAGGWGGGGFGGGGGGFGGFWGGGGSFGGGGASGSW